MFLKLSSDDDSDDEDEKLGGILRHEDKCLGATFESPCVENESHEMHGSESIEVFKMKDGETRWPSSAKVALKAFSKGA